MSTVKVSLPLGSRELGPSGEKLLVEICSTGPVAIAGPNGAGKSAFMHDLFKLTMSAGHGGDWLPAHRAITFDSDSYMVTSTEAEQTLSDRLRWETNDDGRYRQRRRDSHIKAVVQRLVDVENQRNRDFRERAREDFAGANNVDIQIGSVLDDINRIFESSALSVRFILERGLLTAKKSGDLYPIPWLSDGERAALLLAISFVSARPNDILYIDEPEKHLNPAIAQPLVRTLVDFASHVSVVMASHDLDLLEGVGVSQFYVLTDSVPRKWYDIKEVSLEDVQLLESAKKLVLGGRKKVLLIEGDRGSLDVNLYPYVYPGWTVEPTGGWETVVARVDGMRQSPKWNWIEACGLIDLDGRDASEVAALKLRDIHALPATSVESLFLLSGVMAPMAALKHQTDGGPTKDKRLRAASSEAIAALYKDVEDLASRVAAWRYGRLVGANKPSAAQIRKGEAPPIHIDPAVLQATALTELEELRSSSTNLDDHVRRVPVKPTGATNAAAKALGFPSFSAYAQAVFHHLSTGSETGQAVLAALKLELPALN